MEIKELFCDIIIATTVLLVGVLMFCTEYQRSKAAIYVPTTGTSSGSGAQAQPITIGPYTRIMIGGLISYAVYKHVFGVDILNPEIEEEEEEED